MFSFQFGTFESSTPGWFEWFSLLLTLVVSAGSIYFAYKLADRTFKQEQIFQKINEKERADNDFKLFSQFLKNLLTPLDKQRTDLINLISDPFRVVLSFELSTSIIHHIDFNRIFFQYPEIVESTNELLILLEELNIINKTIQSESRNFSKDTNFKYEEIRNLNVELENKFSEMKKIYKYEKSFANSSSTYLEPIYYIIELENIIEEVYKSENFIEGNDDYNFQFLINNFNNVVIELGEKYDFYESVLMRNLARTINYKFTTLGQRNNEHQVNLNNKLDFVQLCIKKIKEYLSKQN